MCHIEIKRAQQLIASAVGGRLTGGALRRGGYLVELLADVAFRLGGFKDSHTIHYSSTIRGRGKCRFFWTRLQIQVASILF